MEEDAISAERRNKTRTLPKPLKVLLISLSIVMTFFGVLALSLVWYTLDKETFAKGVSLEIPLGQLTLEEAEENLEQLRHELHKRPVQLISDENNVQITLEELGFNYAYQEPLQEAYLIGREGTLFDKAISKYNARSGITFKPDYQWNDLILAKALTTHLSSLNIPAEDAHFSVNPDNSLQIVSEKLGKQIDLDSLIASIKKQALNEDPRIPVPFNSITPSLTKTDLEHITKSAVLSDYTTYFDPNQKERSFNIKLAARAIDGLVLKPREVFSFNDTVGPRTIEAGYQVAMIIEGNTFVPGLGGGICQVSSTLYNAVRLASPRLSVVERSPHSLPVTYVPLGQDATVAYPFLDFKFRNDSDGYLLIRSFVSNNTVAFSLYGT